MAPARDSEDEGRGSLPAVRWRTGARLVFIGAVLSIGAAVVSFLIWAVWYRSTDHTARLLAERSAIVKIEERTVSNSGGQRVVAFKLLDLSGRVTTGEMRVPAGARGPMPAFLILGGHETGGKAAGLIHIQEPVIICAMDYPSYPRWKAGVLRAPGVLSQLDSRAMSSVGMSFAVLDYLCSRPEVDTSRVVVLGASFGAPFAVIAAALDPRPKGLVLLYGAGDLERIIDWNLRGDIRSRILRWPASRILGALTSPFEPSAYIGRVSPRPILMVNGRNDEKMPPPCVELLYRRAGEPKEIVWIGSSHVEPSDRGLIDSLTTVVSGWLKKNRLL